MALPVDERTPLLQTTPVPPLLPFPRDDRRRSDTSSPSPPPRRPSTRQAAAKRNEDVELSLSQLVKVAASLKAGHLPSTRQFLDWTEYALACDWLAPDPNGTVFEPIYGQGRLGVGALSAQGENVRLAAREWVQSSRVLVLERNPRIDRSDQAACSEAGDAWQEFFWRCKTTEVEFDPPKVPELSMSTSPRSAIGSSILTLVTLFFTSPEIRQLLIDLIVLVRDVAQVTLATEVREDRVPADVGEGIEKAVDFVARESVGKVALDRDMKRDSERKVGRETERPREEDVPNPPLVDDAKTFEDPPIAELDPKPENRGENGADPAIRDRSAEEIKDAFVDRFKSILSRLQSTAEYQSATRTLLGVARSFVKDSFEKPRLRVSVEPSAPPPRSSPSSPFDLVRGLFEPFTGGSGSLSPLMDAYNSTLSHFSSANPDSAPHALLELASTFDSFLSHALLSPHYLSSSEAHRTLARLYDEFAKLGDDQRQFYHDSQTFLRESVHVLETFSQDDYLGGFVASNVRLLGAVEKWCEVAGGKAVKAASRQGVGAFWGDFVEWIAPRLFGIVKEVPIPRIEFSSPQVTGALELPSLLSTSFVPAEFTIKNATSLTYLPTLGSSHQDLPVSHSCLPRGPKKSFFERTAYASNTSLDVKGMEFEILDVGYFVKVNTGIPCCFSTVTESGLLDLHFGATDADGTSRGGFEFSLDASSLESQVERDHQLFTMLPSSRVTLERFDIKLHESEHPWLAWLIRPLLKAAVRKAIEVEVRKVVIEQGDRIGDWAYRFKENKREIDDAADAKPRNADGKGTAMAWIKAFWRTVTEDREPGKVEQGQEGGGTAPRTDTAVHLNRHGIAIDLPHSVDEGGEQGAVVGIGTEGVVVPEGDAAIPAPPGEERIGVVKKAKQEANEAVEAGRKAAKNTFDVIGGIGEASEEWGDDLEDERAKYEKHGWRSDAFELRV